MGSNNILSTLMGQNTIFNKRKYKEASGLASNETCETRTILKDLEATKGPTMLDIGKVDHVGG